MKTHNGIAKVATAAATLLMASCSMPVQVPVQTQQQQQNNQTFIDQLRKLIPSRTQPNSGAQLRPWEEWDAAPATLPRVVWPAPGAGDYQPVVIPDVLPSVVWPAPGAGDFETRPPMPVVAQPQWLVGPVFPVVAPPVNNVAPDNVIAINPARETTVERAQRVTPQAAPRLTRQDMAERAAQRAVDGPNWTPPERETAFEYVIAINPAREAAVERAQRVTPQPPQRVTRQDMAERAAQRAVDGP